MAAPLVIAKLNFFCNLMLALLKDDANKFLSFNEMMSENGKKYLFLPMAVRNICIILPQEPDIA